MPCAQLLRETYWLSCLQAQLDEFEVLRQEYNERRDTIVHRENTPSDDDAPQGNLR